MERTFTIHGASITVRPATIRDAIQRDLIMAALVDQYPDNRVAVVLFATELAQSTMDGEIDGWVIPPVEAPEDVIGASFAHWLDLPGAVYRAWQEAIAQVDGLVEEPDEEKKASG